MSNSLSHSGGQSPPEERVHTVVSMVLLPKAELPDFDKVIAMANALDPAHPVRIEYAKDERRDGGLVTCGDQTAFIAYVGGRIPTKEVEECLIASRLWKKGKSVAHKAHVIIGTKFEKSSLAIPLLSRIGAAILKSCHGVGWYVGSAMMVTDSDFAYDLVEAFATQWQCLVMLWVNVIVSQDSDTEFSGSTIGLEEFGHHEFEIVRCHMQPTELTNRLLDLIAHVLEFGPVYKNGDTMGRTATEKLPITVGPSKLGKEGIVIRIGFP